MELVKWDFVMEEMFFRPFDEASLQHGHPLSSIVVKRLHPMPDIV